MNTDQVRAHASFRMMCLFPTRTITVMQICLNAPFRQLINLVNMRTTRLQICLNAPFRQLINLVNMHTTQLQICLNAPFRQLINLVNMHTNSTADKKVFWLQVAFFFLMTFFACLSGRGVFVLKYISFNFYSSFLVLFPTLFIYHYVHIIISMGESNTFVSAFTLYRHIQQYCSHPSISCITYLFVFISYC